MWNLQLHKGSISIVLETTASLLMQCLPEQDI